ncbi:MAG: hypothetical protein CMP61_03755 [Flavobacteriales bacterium]|nr:hypothetical protein [Flavobacteriales bacterium]|tara:strand:- start:1140 stop:2027 length:888 start_codon:yes stop_codon:yes gene_type:complete
MNSLLMKFIVLLFISLLFFNCKKQKNQTVRNIKNLTEKSIIQFSRPSELKNEYLNFNSPFAINKLVSIENQYFNDFEHSVSNYYGTEWRGLAETTKLLNDSICDFELYWNEMTSKGIKPDSMHCTIYAIEALKTGMDTLFDSLEVYHKKIWKDREHAGWSIAHILVKYYNWKAYVFISESSNEFNRVKKNFNQGKFYYVWKQPSVDLTGYYNFDNDKDEIDSLLKENEFGWGFSDQGYHTWITRFDTLKECIWTGAPSSDYDQFGVPLFKKTPFTDYFDYSSHIIVFPPKKSNNN